MVSHSDDWFAQYFQGYGLHDEPIRPRPQPWVAHTGGPRMGAQDMLILNALAQELRLREVGEVFWLSEFNGVTSLKVGDQIPGRGTSPEVFHDPTGDVTIMDAAWKAVTGLTSQYGYSGAVMDPSETIDWRIAAEMVRLSEEPTWWAFVEVTDDEGDLVGWSIVYRPVAGE